jgi:hypothetical protein
MYRQHIVAEDLGFADALVRIMAESVAADLQTPGQAGGHQGKRADKQQQVCDAHTHACQHVLDNVAARASTDTLRSALPTTSSCTLPKCTHPTVPYLHA